MGDEQVEQPEGDRSGAEQESGRRGGFLKFWTTLPGVLTGLAAVIAAVVSLVALFGPGDRDPGAGSGPTVASGAPAPTAGSGSGPTSAPGSGLASGPASGTVSPPTSAPASTGVAHQGTMTLAIDEFADLRAGTVSTNRGTDSEFFLFGNGGYRLTAAVGQTFAFAEAVDKAACATALTQRTDRQVLLSELRGRTVCVLLGSQQVAALTVTAAPAVGSPRIAFDYVVWD